MECSEHDFRMLFGFLNHACIMQSITHHDCDERFIHDQGKDQHRCFGGQEGILSWFALREMGRKDAATEFVRFAMTEPEKFSHSNTTGYFHWGFDFNREGELDEGDSTEYTISQFIEEYDAGVL